MLLLIILLPLLLGTTLSWWLERYSRLYSCIAASLISFVSFISLVFSSSQFSEGKPLLQQWQWVPEIGLNISLRLDGLAFIFALLITGIGTLICIYAFFYLSSKNSLGKLYSLLMLFMASMLGIGLSNNILLLSVFWELTSISSFLLVGYWKHYEAAQRGALMALTITGLGGLALLGGVITLGYIGGTYELDMLLGMREQIQASPYFNLALMFILIAAFTKSAQVPFHFWLPNAMAAPTPVSAYLHSATMVKAGIFLIARLFPLLVGSVWFHGVVTAVGLITLCFAAFIAIFKHDLKGLLAYSTLSHLGLIVCLLGIGSPLAVAAALFHVLNHATFKAALFMLAGVIDHQTGTRNLRKLGGLWTVLPWTATLSMVAAAAMGGIPLTNGFLSKEMFLTEVLTLTGGTWLLIVPLLATLGALFGITYSIRFVHNTFFSGAISPRLPNKNITEASLGMRAPIILLCVLCIAVGLVPAFFAQSIVQLGVSAMLNYSPMQPVHLAIWHGINMPLVMSIIAIVGGTLLYFILANKQRIQDIHSEHWFGKYAGDELFDRLLAGSVLGARKLVSTIENGSLQRYLVVIIVATLVMATVPLWGEQLRAGGRLLNHASWVAITLWFLLLVSCFMLLYFHHERIKAVLLVGAIGLVVAMAFIGLSAPDLALTQISVDIVSTVLLLMSLSLLPQLTPYESSSTRHWRDVAIAVAGGSAVAWIAWLIITRDHSSISWFFMQESLPKGGGSNVVNVILVDFRGFDTFGEICVLAIAAVGALVMMDGMRAHGAIATPGLTLRFNPSPLMLRMTASWVLPIALLYSLYILLRGHNLPGGGFIAGLITAIALIIQYIALGQERAEALIRAREGRLYEYWIGSGLCIAGLTGVGALFWGRPFLTSAHFDIHVPLIGDIPFATAMLFDIGVFLTVTGSTLLLISVLGDSRHSTVIGPVPPRGDA